MSYSGYDGYDTGYNYYDGSLVNENFQRKLEADPYEDECLVSSRDSTGDEGGQLRSRSHHDLFIDGQDSSPSGSAPRRLSSKTHSWNGFGRPTLQPDRIPVPSPSYLQLVNQPSAKLAHPTLLRKLLVLDLNGTLLYREPRVTRDGRDPYATDEPRPLRTVHLRPYIPSLRAFLFHPETRKWLDTMVWSSAQFPNVKDMVGGCFGEDQVEHYTDVAEGEDTQSQKDGLVAVWDRKFLGLSEAQYRNKTQTTKNLDKPWALLPISSFSGPSKTLSDAWDRVALDEAEAVSEFPTSSALSESRLNHTSFLESLMEAHHPSRNDILTHSARSTILLDDSPLKARMQPFNHVCVPEYDKKFYLRDVRIANSESKSTPALPDAVGESQPPSEFTLFKHELSTGKRKRGRSSSSLISPPGKKKGLDSEDASVSLKHHDHIILAVIGLLDALKHESSVAAWIKAQGLFALDRAEDSATTPMNGDPEAKKILENNDKKLDRLYLERVPEGTSRSIKKGRHRHRHRDGEFNIGGAATTDGSESGNDLETDVEDEMSSRALSLEHFNMSQHSISTGPISRPLTPESRATEPATPPSAVIRRELQRKAHLLPRPIRRNPPPTTQYKEPPRPPTPTFIESVVLYGQEASSLPALPAGASTPAKDMHQRSAGSSFSERDIFSNPRQSPPGLTGEQFERETGIATGQSNASASAPVDISRSLPSLWYQHPSARWYWARRGVAALKELDLELISGVHGDND